MERLNTFLIVLLFLFNGYFFFSIKETSSTAAEHIHQVELAELQNQMSVQFIAMESEIRALHKTLSDFPNIDWKKVKTIEQRERSMLNKQKSNSEKRSAFANTYPEVVIEVNDFVSTIIDSGIIDHDTAFELHQELSKLSPDAFEDTLSRINIAINRQELQLEPGVVF